MLLPLRLVSALPFNVGKKPEPSSNTNWLAPLKVLPWRVTLLVSRASAMVPLVTAVPLRLGAEPSSAGKPEPSRFTNWFCAIKGVALKGYVSAQTSVVKGATGDVAGVNRSNT